MTKIRTVFVLFICALFYFSYSQETTDYSKSLVSFDDYEVLISEVKNIRAKRLISFDELLAFQEESNTVILDTRSKDKYVAKHLKGAINLPFTEFTTSNLRRLIPDVNTRIIIYCNNNFKGDAVYFTSKVYTPEMFGKRKMIKDDSTFGLKSITLALNIPTYLGLYGYGYRNIYELDELVNIDDPRVRLKGNNSSIKIRSKF